MSTPLPPSQVRNLGRGGWGGIRGASLLGRANHVLLERARCEVSADFLLAASRIRWSLFSLIAGLRRIGLVMLT